MVQRKKVKEEKAESESNQASLEVDSDLVEELSLALEDFEPQDPETKKNLQTALANVVKDKLLALDLNEIDDAELMAKDTTAQGRRIYIGSLLRLWSFLARKPLHADMEEKQARLALSFVKHVEGSKSLAFSFGRTQSDKALVKEVRDLRAQLHDLVEDRMALNQGNIIDVEEVPQAEAGSARPEKKSSG